MQRRTVGHALDAHDVALRGIKTEHQTRENRTAVNQDSAGTTFAEFTTVFGAGEIEIFAQNLEQSLMWREGDLCRFAVQRKLNMRFLFHSLTEETNLWCWPDPSSWRRCSARYYQSGASCR